MPYPSPTTPVDELVADPVPALEGFIKGTDIKGNIIHIAVPHIVMIIPGPNYNTFSMTDGRVLQIVSFEEVPP